MKKPQLILTCFRDGLKVIVAEIEQKSWEDDGKALTAVLSLGSLFVGRHTVKMVETFARHDLTPALVAVVAQIAKDTQDLIKSLR